MKILKKIELFGDDQYQAEKMWVAVLSRTIAGLGEVVVGDRPARPWVAELTGLDPKWKFIRQFLNSTKDYSEANSIGSRGIFLYYYLDEGKYYEIKEQLTWRKWDRYFCRTAAGKIEKITEDEVLEWLRNRSE